jgi:CelD/BcsL family acetyltransferase involved in cellulose biosynthesis
MSSREGATLTPGEPTDQDCRDWADLLTESEADTAFLSPQWLLPWWQVYGPTQGRRPWTFTHHQQGRLIGFAPLSLRTHFYHLGVPLRRWEIWGSGEEESDAICSDYLNLLARRGAEETVAQELVRCLEGHGQGDEIVIPLMDRTQRQTQALAEAFRRRGWWGETEASTESRWIRLPGTWEAYLASLKQRHRYWVRRTRRDLEAWAGASLQVREARKSEDLVDLRAQLIQLHQERWNKASGGTFRTPLFLTFHRRIQEQWLARGQLQLAVLSCLGRPVAAVYNLYWRDRVLFYQCGRSLQVPHGVRPGAWILAWSIEKAIERGYRSFDFLGGVAPYKAQFAPEVRPLVQLRYRRPCLTTGFQRGMEEIKKRIRSLSAWRPVSAQSVESRGEERSRDENNSSHGRIR